MADSGDYVQAGEDDTPETGAENMEIQREDDVQTLDEGRSTGNTDQVQGEDTQTGSLTNTMDDSQDTAEETSENVDNSCMSEQQTETAEGESDHPKQSNPVEETASKSEDATVSNISNSTDEQSTREETSEIRSTETSAKESVGEITKQRATAPNSVRDEERFREAPHDREIDVPINRISQVDEFHIDPGTAVKIKPKAKVKRKMNHLHADETTKEMWKIPFEIGWGREIVFRATTADGKRIGDVYYFSPEGKKFRSLKEIEKYMAESHSSMSIDCFTFRKQPVFKEPFEIIRNAKNMPGRGKGILGSPSSIESPERQASPVKKPGSGNKKKKGQAAMTKQTTPIGSLKIKFPKASFSPHTPSLKGAKSPPVAVKNELGIKSPTIVVKPSVKQGNVAKKHTGKRKPVTVLINGNGKKPKMSTENSQRLCDLTCGQNPPSLHCEVCMCLFHPSCVGFTPRPGAKFICKGCGEGESSTDAILPNQILSTNQGPTRPRIVASSVAQGIGTVIRLAGAGASIIPPIIGSSSIITSPLNNRQVSPVSLLTTRTQIKPTAPAQPPAIRLNIPASSVNPDQISGQLITLPPHVTNKLNLTKPLNLKLNGQTYNIPPKCFIATNEGVKVLLPPGSLPDNIAKGGPASPLAMSASSNHVGSQQLNVRPMVDTGLSDSTGQAISPSNKGVVDLTENTRPGLGSQGKRKTKLHIAHSVCHFGKLHTGFDCMVHIFQYLGTTDLLRVQLVCKTWYGVASQSCLWKSLRLKNVRVTDWEAAASYMARQRTQALDLRIMAHPNNDANRTWHQLHGVLGQLKCLRQIEFSQCPSSILHAITEKLTNLELCVAEFIVEQVQDSRETNAKLDLGKLSSLTELECLKLRGVQGLVLPAFSFSGGLQELGSLVKIRTLALTTLRDLPANEFQFLGSLTNLETLEMGDTMSWSEETFAQLGKLTKLKNLRLEAGGSLKSESLGTALKALKELSQLELINFVISEKLGECLAELTWLKVFSVWPNKENEFAPAVNSNLLKATSNMSSLQLLEWGVMNECTSENESFIPLVPSAENKEDGGENGGAAGGEDEDVSLLPQVVSINELIKRLSSHLPDTKIRVFKVPGALIKKACPSRGPSLSPSPELVMDVQQQEEEVVEEANGGDD